MAGLQEKKQFIGGLDRDTDERFIKEGDYSFALNLRNQSSESDNLGVLQNIKGTTAIGFNFPSEPSLFVHVSNVVFHPPAEDPKDDIPKH